MTTASTIPMCTLHQRQYIRLLLSEKEIPAWRVTQQHRALFDQAGIAWVDGASLTDTLRAVSKAAAHRLIDAIRENT